MMQFTPVHSTTKSPHLRAHFIGERNNTFFLNQVEENVQFTVKNGGFVYNLI